MLNQFKIQDLTPIMTLHFGKRQATAQKHFIRFLKDAKGQSPLWENLRQQFYLGDEKFVHRLLASQTGSSDYIETPKRQRQCPDKSLDYYSKAHTQRDDAIHAAFQSGQYTQTEIAGYFDLHYSTVSKIIKKYEKESK